MNKKVIKATIYPVCGKLQTCGKEGKEKPTKIINDGTK
jgi:hypothetical protein